MHFLDFGCHKVSSILGNFGESSYACVVFMIKIGALEDVIICNIALIKKRSYAKNGLYIDLDSECLLAHFSNKICRLLFLIQSFFGK